MGADLPVGLDPDGLTKAGGSLWIASEGDGKLYRFRPHDVEKLLVGLPPAH